MRTAGKEDARPWTAYVTDLSGLRENEVEASVDGDLIGHEDRVARTTRSIAREMGLDQGVVERMTVAARYHDIGKLQVDASILRKEGRFESHERRIMESHAELGARTLERIEGVDPMMVDAARYHHERYDGHGYAGLSGDDIPLVARVVAVADVHDALTQKRCYKPGIPEAVVLSMMTEDGPADRPARDAFDPAILRTFVAMRLSDPAFHVEEDRRLAQARSEMPGEDHADRRVELAAFAASPVPSPSEPTGPRP